jgi:uncharacterized protein YeaO (DUF488 family)
MSAAANHRVDVRVKRAYEPAQGADGYRVLVDRLWPRGLSRGRARLDLWEPELAPSSDLRQWFGHDPARFKEFRRRYRAELRQQRRRIDSLRRAARSGRVTLVYSARDTEHNQAVVLAEVIRHGLPAAASRRLRSPHNHSPRRRRAAAPEDAQTPASKERHREPERRSGAARRRCSRS